MSLAKINKYAVSNSLNTDRIVSLGRVAGSGGIYTTRFYFVMRGVLDIKRRKILKRLTRTSILKLSLRIASEGLRGDLPVRGEYHPFAGFRRSGGGGLRHRSHHRETGCEAGVLAGAGGYMLGGCGIRDKHFRSRHQRCRRPPEKQVKVRRIELVESSLYYSSGGGNQE